MVIVESRNERSSLLLDFHIRLDYVFLISCTLRNAVTVTPKIKAHWIWIIISENRRPVGKVFYYFVSMRFYSKVCRMSANWYAIRAIESIICGLNKWTNALDGDERSMDWTLCATMQNLFNVSDAYTKQHEHDTHIPKLRNETIRRSCKQEHNSCALPG